MKTKTRFLHVITIALLLVIMLTVCVNAFEQTVTQTENTISTVNVKINGQALNSPYASVMVNDTTVVPLRAVMEQLGWEVLWDESTESVNVTNGNDKINFCIGSHQLTHNGNVTVMAVAPYLIGDVTYVPVRAITEALGAVVGWDAYTNTASIYTGKASSTLKIGDYAVTAGAPVSELITSCGEPTYKVMGDKGLEWYVYSDYLTAFMAVATDKGLVCGYYTNSALFHTSDGYVYGSDIPEGTDQYRALKGDGYKVELFYDKTEGVLCAIQYMLDGFYNDYSVDEALTNQARMGLDVLNSFRYSHGKPPLTWNESAAVSCTEHAYYMASSGKLTHTGADGSSAIDRYLMQCPGEIWLAWGETICAGTNSIFNCINGWINSDFNRSIILSDKKSAGIGFVNMPQGKFKYATAMLLIK